MPSRHHFPGRQNNRTQQPIEPGPGAGSGNGNPPSVSQSDFPSSSLDSFDQGAPLPPLPHEATTAGEPPHLPQQLPGGPPPPLRQSLQSQANLPPPPSQGHLHQLSPQSPQPLHRLPQQLQPDQTTPLSPHQQQQQQQNPSLYSIGHGGNGSKPLLVGNPISPPFDTRQPPGQKPTYIDPVARSQSQRYPGSLQTNHPHLANSADDLGSNIHIGSPTIQEDPVIVQQQQQQQQQPPPKERSSARRFFGKILDRGSGRDHHQQAPPPQQQQPPPGAYNNTAGLTRHPSKRVSQQPVPRTGGSQLSLDTPQQLEWQSSNVTQPSPLQGVGEHSEAYFVRGGDQQERLPPSREQRDLRDPRDHTIRAVPHLDADDSPYDDESYDQQQARALAQEQAARQQNRYSQHPALDPSHTQFQQFQQQQQQHQQQQSQRGPYQHLDPLQLPGHLVTNQLHNPETVSQISRDSPVTDSDQRSNILPPPQASPAAALALPSSEGHPQRTHPGSLPPPGQPQPQPSKDPRQPLQPPGHRYHLSREEEDDDESDDDVEPPPGPPPNYQPNQSQQLQPGTMNPHTGPPGGGPPGNYRQGSLQERPGYDGSVDQGRSSPQPSTNEKPDAAEIEKQFKDMLVKYKNVKRLYFEGKAQIEQYSHQVEVLQNAVANQRISQSRTMLDDSEYTTRFGRLGGAINNLAFNIRKDWRDVPEWIEDFVTPDAIRTGKQEMTAVGRAIITKWIAEELFARCFHPGLDPRLSRALKEIEFNIRAGSHTIASTEEREALTTKIIRWRLATLDGLAPALRSPESARHREEFVNYAKNQLINMILGHLHETPSAGIDGSVSGIIELAVGIAANLSQESRDVCVFCPQPRDPVNPALMEIEKQALPPLEKRPLGAGGGDGSDNGGTAGGGGGGGEDPGRDDKASGGKASQRKGPGASLAQMLGSQPPGRKGSVAGNGGGRGGGGAGAGDAANPGPPGSAADGGGPLGQAPGGSAEDANLVRFAGSFAVEVRDRQVLVKAPVWTIG